MGHIPKADVKSTAAQYHQIKPSVTWPDGLKVWSEMVGITANKLVPNVWRVMFINACMDGTWDESLNGVL